MTMPNPSRISKTYVVVFAIAAKEGSNLRFAYLSYTSVVDIVEEVDAEGEKRCRQDRDASAGPLAARRASALKTGKKADAHGERKSKLCLLQTHA
jgi:hypothetical protein